MADLVLPIPVPTPAEDQIVRMLLPSIDPSGTYSRFYVQPLGFKGIPHKYRVVSADIILIASAVVGNRILNIQSTMRKDQSSNVYSNLLLVTGNVAASESARAFLGPLGTISNISIGGTSTIKAYAEISRDLFISGRDEVLITTTNPQAGDTLRGMITLEYRNNIENITQGAMP